MDSKQRTVSPQVKRLRSELKHRNKALAKFAGLAHVLQTIAAIVEAPTNRFGKLECYTETSRAACE